MTIALLETVSSAAAPSAQNATRVPFLGAKRHALGLVVMKSVVGRVQLLARQRRAIRDRRVGFVRLIRHLKRQEERQGEERRRRRIGVMSRRNCECLSSLIFIMVSSSNGDGLDARRLTVPKAHAANPAAPSTPASFATTPLSPAPPSATHPIGVCPPDPVGKKVVEPYDQFAKGVDASVAAAASSACLATTNTEAFATRVYDSSGLANGATPEPFTGSIGVTTVVPAPTPASKMTVVSEVPESVKTYFCGGSCYEGS